MTRVIWWTGANARPVVPAAEPGFHLTPVGSVSELLLFVRNSMCDVAVLDTSRICSATDDLLLELGRTDRTTAVVVVCAHPTPDETIRMVRLGAFHVIDSTVAGDGLFEHLRAAAESSGEARKSPTNGGDTWRRNLVGTSEAMRRVLDIVGLVAARRSTVLISGETGTGKEVVARALHLAGGRGHLPFVAVNCSAIPENLVESELFGYMKGAFTGAQQSRPGRFEQAAGGTVFLDEIGELPLEVQAKLLRVLQEREIQRLGGGETIRLNARIIAATNQDLEEAVRQRRFRQDLFYRLNVVPLHLPALRERRGDIPALAGHFLTRICDAEGLTARRITPAALEVMTAYAWPGNIRQLEHSIEMAVVLSGDRSTLDVADFPILLRESDSEATDRNSQPMLVPDEGLDFEATVSHFERSILQQALTRCNGNKARAAQLLRMKRTTLLARMKSLEAHQPYSDAFCA